MNYNPDKFEIIATRVVSVVLFVVFAGFLIAITIVRFGDPDKDMFSTANIVKGLVALAVLAILGWFIPIGGDKKT